jgi:hypothetical protein
MGIWIAAFVTLNQAILTLFIKESQILKQRVAQQNQATSSDTPFTIDNPDQNPPLQSFITDFLTRPTCLFIPELIVFLVTIMFAIAFG